MAASRELINNFVEPMELTDVIEPTASSSIWPSDSESDGGQLFDSTSRSARMRKRRLCAQDGKKARLRSHDSKRSRALQIPNILDRLFSFLPAAESHLEAISLDVHWSRCHTASEYLAILARIHPRLQQRYMEQQSLVAQLQQDLEIATVQARRHLVYIDEQAGKISPQARQRYLGDVKMYERTARKIELHIKHQRTIADLRYRTTVLLKTLSEHLDEASVIEERLTEHLAPHKMGDSEAQCESPMIQNAVRHHEEAGSNTMGDGDEAESPTSVSAPWLSTALQEIEIYAKATGCIVNSLLQAEHTEHVQIAIQMAGWEMCT